jgi:hypothetical protein
MFAIGFVLFSQGLVAFATSCPTNTTCIVGSGKVITETRSVSDFSHVVLEGVGKVIIQQGDTETLTVTSDDNIVPVLTSEVRDGKLILGVKERTTIQNQTEITFRVMLRALRGVQLSGAGDMTAQQINTNLLELNLSGAGSITASGTSEKLTIIVNGAGAVNTENLASTNATIAIGGSGNVIVNAKSTLDVTISGIGTVEYLGDPQITKQITGVGSVKQRTAVSPTPNPVPPTTPPTPNPVPQPFPPGWRIVWLPWVWGR